MSVAVELQLEKKKEKQVKDISCLIKCFFPGTGISQSTVTFVTLDPSRLIISSDNVVRQWRRKCVFWVRQRV